MRAEKINSYNNYNNSVKIINPVAAATVGGIAGYALKYIMPLSNYEKKTILKDTVSFSSSLSKKSSRPAFYFVAIGAIIASAIVCLGNNLIASEGRK